MQIYYQPENLWKGRKAITRLRKATKLPLKQVRDWLAKQALWQVHMPPPPKRIDHSHFYVTKVNKMHQADLLYLPHDKVYQNTYKYVLNVIDVASRYKASRPLKTKKASEVAEMFKDIYKKGPLKYPVELHVDNGTEFKAEKGNAATWDIEKDRNFMGDLSSCEYLRRWWISRGFVVSENRVKIRKSENR